MPRIVFVVMSAVAPAATVDQLARALAPHTVLVHHDFAQTPDFRLTAPNARFVPAPVRTGWASFGFVEGIFHSLDHACRHLEFDYLQLLSPSCLPIKPMAQFEQHVDAGVDAHFGSIDLLADADCLMNVGYRAFTPEGSLRHRALRRLSMRCFGPTPGRREEAGVWLRTGGVDRWPSVGTRLLLRALARPWFGRHPFGAQLRPYYGSVWFGARRPIVQGMVDLFAQPRIRKHFSRLRIAEEFLVPTLLMRLARNRGPINHHVHRFVEAHPSPLEEADFALLQHSPAFFARKFPSEALSPVRQRVLAELVQAGSGAEAPAPEPVLAPALNAVDAEPTAVP